MYQLIKIEYLFVLLLCKSFEFMKTNSYSNRYYFTLRILFSLHFVYKKEGSPESLLWSRKLNGLKEIYGTHMPFAE